MHANSRKPPNDPFVQTCHLKSAKGVLKFANMCVNKPVKRYTVDATPHSVLRGQVTPAAWTHRVLRSHLYLFNYAAHL